MKPQVFIGSSSEGLEVARAIEVQLESDAEITVWKDGVFGLGEGSLESLVNSLSKFDFAILILTADDMIVSRGKEIQSPRDNVLLELGLFIGRLGRQRTFVVYNRDNEIKLPSDLAGVSVANYGNRQDGNLIAALGPGSTKIRNAIRSLGLVFNSSPQAVHTYPQESEPTKPSDQKPIETEVPRLQEKDLVHFWYRIADAFPGVRGVKWFDKPEIAVERLALLLRQPLTFRASPDGTLNPIWWLRGTSNNAIESFEILNGATVLMNRDELTVSKVAVLNANRYKNNFVYVEAAPAQPTGLYNYSLGDIERQIEQFGYASEEYGLLNGIPITRAEYDDGSAIIDEKVVDANGADLRSRYLSSYNFIISAQSSPINSVDFDDISEPYLNGLLRGTHKFEDLVEIIMRLR